MAPESYAEIPTDAQANYMFPYMYPVPETYDYTKEDLPCYPTSVGFSSLATVMADNLQAAVDAGAEVRYSTKGVELILNDEGAVAGIYAQAAGSDGYIKDHRAQRHSGHGRLPGQRGHDEVLRAGMRGKRHQHPEHRP